MPEEAGGACEANGGRSSEGLISFCSEVTACRMDKLVRECDGQFAPVVPGDGHRVMVVW